MGLIDLEKHYVFYGSYHSNGVNKIIHVIFVWPILFTALILLNYVPLHLSTTIPIPLLPSPPHFFSLNVSFIVAIIYAAFYALLEAKAGSIAASLVLFLWAAAQWTVFFLGAETAWKAAVAVQILSWASQFLGHGIFEGRAPALLDNLFQAFLMAPFFVLLEILELSVGFEPYEGFRRRVKETIQQKVEEFRAAKIVQEGRKVA